MSSSSKDRLVSHPHQSLWRHLASVDEVSQRALAAKVLHPDLFGTHDVESLRRLLVYFHDFGKGTDFFQWMITEVARRENPDYKNLDAAYVAQFGERASAEVASIGRDGGSLRGHSQLGAFVSQTAITDGSNRLLSAIVYEVIARHHGNLRNFEGDVERGTEDFTELLDKQWAHMNHTDYRAILKKTGFIYADNLDEVQQQATKRFFARVYDQLEENETLLPYLQAVFLFSLLLAGDKGDLMLPERSLVGRGRRCDERLIDRYKTQEFGTSISGRMNAWREEAYQRVADNLAMHSGRGFYSITLPTGMGKTLTAYNAAILLQNNLADRWREDNPNCVPRIIYCLPFTSVIDQNAAILEDILSLDPGMKGELAKHHYLADWTEHKADHDAILSYSEKEYLVEGWEYTLTVTTFVQLLETIISNRNRKLRKFHNLANAVVVLDEVQSIPPKYFNVVSKVLVALHEYLNTRFIFVTATQPFLMNPADGHEVLELTDPTRDYTRRAFERMNRIDLDCRLWQDGPEEVEEQVELFKSAIRNESQSSFLFILNLVRESQQVYRALAAEEEPGVEYLYLSSAILPIRRKEIIERIKEESLPGVRQVVVSTQVVEAGVDIDLDVVYRAFAPLDSINQSAGRCNRNMRKGRRGSVRLFKSKNAEKIYDVVLLNRTQLTLRDQLRTESERADYRAGILPEGRFYELNQSYMRQMREAVADNNDTSREILEDLYALRFERANERFKLIRKDYTTYGVFIDDADTLPTATLRLNGKERQVNSNEIYQMMRDILCNDEWGRWKKKQELRLIRPALLQYVVQFPEQYLPEDLRAEAETKPFIRLHKQGGDCDYSRCYHLSTGYFKSDDQNPTHSF